MDRLLIAIISTSAFTALLTALLNRLLDRRRRDRQARGYLSGIQFEISYAKEFAEAYVRDAAQRPVWAPNYRAVTEFTRLHVPWLSAEGYLQLSTAHTVEQSSPEGKS